jgi:hypothetical protein
MKALLKATWFQYTLTMIIISSICFFAIGPEGVYFGPLFLACYFLEKLITAILTGR